jgi:hypothetical protein
MMDENILENCPHADSGQCTQPDAVARAYLIPQLVERSEVEATKQICRTCGKYLGEKREYPRVRRPLSIILSQGKKAAIEGEIVNISEGGALVKLKNWADFDEEQKITLEVYFSHAASGKGVGSKMEFTGKIIRVDDQERQVAIAF